jgi:two-component system phosphate regulon response regulator PhoB
MKNVTKKLLIVEDQSDIRRLLKQTLEQSEFEIIEARDGSTGLALARSQQPDVVLLDIMMPGELDGLEVCRRLKQDPLTSAAKVVFISARGHRHDMLIGRDAGADDYLIKPFSPLRLIEVVEALMAPA